jgi:hypothetical protein
VIDTKDALGKHAQRNQATDLRRKILQGGVRGDAFLGLFDAGLSQPGVRFEVGLVHLVTVDIAPCNRFWMRKVVSWLKFQEHSREGGDSEGTRW